MRKLVFTGLVLLLVAGVAFGQDLGDIKKKISKAADAGDWTSVCTAIRELGSVDSVDSVKYILKCAFALDKSNVSDSAKADCFDAARDALKQISDAEALACIREQLLKNRKWEVRRMLAEVLGEKGGEKDRQALCDLVRKEKQKEVIREAVKWIVQIGGIDSIEALIEALGKIEKSKGLTWVDVRRALTSLTGADYENALKWGEYWRCRKEELKANPGSPDTAAPVTPGEVKTGLLEEEIKKAPKFFGKEILSKRFCFVIDVSGSMAEKDTYSGGGGEAGKGQPVEAMRIKMVQDQLVKLIAALDPKTKFNIIAYSMGVTPWQKSKLVIANSKAKKAAIEFVKKFRPFGTTHTDKAMKEAFTNKEADTIVLLTDGAPTHSGRYDDSSNLITSIFDFVRNANRSRKVTIDTFGFESVTSKHQAQNMGAAFLDFLKRLASENNGTFTNIK
jgi:hypothetical protein